jgi:hypothetical protein
VKVNVPMLCKTAPIDFGDPLLELVPEAYLDSPVPSQADLQSAVDGMVRETAAFLMRFAKMTTRQSAEISTTVRLFPLGEIYNLASGDFHNAANLKPGPIPLVSCRDSDNGVIGHIALSEHVYQGRFTVALNGSPLTAKYHPYRFSAKDDVAVCVPRSPLHLATEMFIMAMVNRERWRYSYYRKCYIEKLKRFRIPLPAKNGEIDESTIRDAVEATPYWKFIQAYLPEAITG